MSNPLDPALFRPGAVSPEVKAFNEAFLKAANSPPPPGVTPPSPFAPKPFAASATVRTVKGAGREVEVRIIPPSNGNPKGAYLHFHGGGLIFGAANQDDPFLQRTADATGLAAVTVEYRLAPAHPYPAAWDDGEAAAAWLAQNLKAEFGETRLAIGGESAGATLAVPILVRMRDKHGFTGFNAANLSYGNYDTSGSPSQHWNGMNKYLIDEAAIAGCSDAYAPDVSMRKNPDMSAVYANLKDMPPALFSVGTLDPFLDDSLFVYARWISAGNEAELAVYPGAPHAFNILGHPHQGPANARIDAFLKAHTS
jgi:acetyl esterase/lipase